MKTSIALAALLVAGAVSAPALAGDSFDNSWYVTQLQQRGVNALEVYQGAPGEVRAVVQTADGRQIFQYFDDQTLAPATGSVGSF